MRIITGKYKNRLIKIPKGIRPTQNKVRKAIFDILGDVEGLSFLELFAGSGAVGLEALSQGVKEAVFVESGPECLSVLKANLAWAEPGSYYLLAMDVERAVRELAKKRKFDIIFLDPPYYQDLSKKTLQMLIACDILAPNGLIVAQHFQEDNLPLHTGDLVLLKQAGYGDTVLSIYRRGSDVPEGDLSGNV
ncbi:MAG: 16S rRNA (guanine(966)-N(2))-methyltransferase RsmD [Candidatus Omnitrophica bacterium]|jgi:16S rRNA (guanine966-N2)-methyltransferase|nr:16S rRNA (guanine(966)-N(2))-methyltransferase RsmD [Candidatus Omnitrophota bacterium]MDD5655252.1 16S rRNA (guanine(966)-N(2))-methyltransferase RsmD [Candidatus Omnitrophota bacterium]